MNSRTRVLLQSVAAVFAGGSVGSLIRISLSKLQAPDASWPWMTLLINLTGSFILGCLLEYLATTGEDVGARRIWRLGLGTGTIGGYTTYSTFILETDTRITGHAVALALVYLAISVVVGLVCAGLGISAGEWLGHRRVTAAAGNTDDTGLAAPTNSAGSADFGAQPIVEVDGTAEAGEANATARTDSQKGDQS
ncbi:MULTISPECIES: fluoride efflux transporter FluC [Bifidobacterium]|uniref:fluoride efflux transporter FluC n=1 Tax=Bifidobacterium TaxID=1678 RepID=UPI00192A667E|nr:CrcB family protein [Bifidobacterium tibiigranuli]MCI1211207.1 CrcB family protein [Bifidobacterium tibiigranuli]MCI1222300.1 CrcB family protein [Bifidobacterium tibiigranuli]MCI1233214.1 CrcB family protein [Bifidobacterium tibiigranuli]MCI1255048.1 CrcB family protein [Bifidobacterium tibiigranuli]